MKNVRFLTFPLIEKSEEICYNTSNYRLFYTTLFYSHKIVSKAVFIFNYPLMKEGQCMINIKKFNEEICKINSKSYNYGNDILYNMASNPDRLFDKEKLDGAMWLIGRSYAASPQRRSYGTMTNEQKENRRSELEEKGYDLAKSVPLWNVVTSNDGRDGFFEAIANYIDIDFLEKDKALLQGAYKYDNSECDYKLLASAMTAVLCFNISLSCAIEKFDEVKNNENNYGDKVFCSNHISFSSKFLHFYFPNSIFIIDNYAFNGGKGLFNGNENNSRRCFYNPDDSNNEPFDHSVYAEFKKNDIKKIMSEIKNYDNIKKLLLEYSNRQRSEDNDTAKIDDYISHCIRSYLLGAHIKNSIKLKPNCQTKASPLVIETITRLTDTVFLNIKPIKSSRNDT